VPELLEAVKSFNLMEFYLSLSIEYKGYLKKYSHYLSCYPKKILSCYPECDGCFMVANGAQFLWATAANAIPEGKLKFAEKLLTHALTLAEEIEDQAWIHANLVQVYHDNHESDPEACRKSIKHCRELIKLGYMKAWAENMMQEMLVYKV